MTNNIAILGGGISGVSTAIILANKGLSVDLYSDNLGGEYLSGGLKYIHDTTYTRLFIESIIGQDYSIRPVNGAIHRENSIFQYPYFFWFVGRLNAEPIQKRYWIKTRGESELFDPKCMNDPWKYREQQCVVPNCGVRDLMDICIGMIRGGIVKGTKKITLINKKLD